MNYQSISANELLNALEQAGRTPDLELIRACLERREELMPGLLEMLAQEEDEDWEDGDPRWYRSIHAALLLCAFREPAALPIFGQVFRDETRDNMLEWLDIGLPAAYGPAAIPMLLDLMNDKDAYEYPRTSVVGMLALIAQNHPQERERIVDAIRAILPPLMENGALSPDAEYSELWTWAVNGLMDLEDTGSQSHVLTLYRAGMIDELIIGDEHAYLASFQKKFKRPPASFDILDTYKSLHRQAAQEAKRKARAARRAAEEKKSSRRQAKQTGRQTGQTVTRQKPQVGRNDPCPCGSGRKYKHCCGKRH